MRWQFDCLADFAKVCDGQGFPDQETSWAGQSLKKSLDWCYHGNTDFVPQAEKLLDKINTSVELKSRQWETDVVGLFPSVPDFVAGHPEHMRRLADSRSEHAPIRVFVCTTSSYSCDAGDLMKRGVAILAAVMGLAQSRPIELWTFTTLHGKDVEGHSNVMVRINSAPLRLSEACVGLCSVGFARQLSYAYAKQHNGFDGRWPRQGGDENGCREILGDLCEPADLVIKSSHVNDEMVLRPVEWVNSIIKKYSQDVEEEYA